MASALGGRTDDDLARHERHDFGILIDGHGSFSIDQQRFNGQFGGQVYHEIKNGRKGDQLVGIQVTVPGELTPEQQDLMKKFADSAKLPY